VSAQAQNPAPVTEMAIAGRSRVSAWVFALTMFLSAFLLPGTPVQQQANVHNFAVLTLPAANTTPLTTSLDGFPVAISDFGPYPADRQECLSRSRRLEFRRRRDQAVLPDGTLQVGVSRGRF